MDVDISLLLSKWNGGREGGVFVVWAVTIGGRGRAVQKRRTIDSIEAKQRIALRSYPLICSAIVTQSGQTNAAVAWHTQRSSPMVYSPAVLAVFLRVCMYCDLMIRRKGERWASNKNANSYVLFGLTYFRVTRTCLRVYTSLPTHGDSNGSITIEIRSLQWEDAIKCNRCNGQLLL